MIDLSNEEWKEAYRLVQAAAAQPDNDAARAAAFDFLRTAESKRLLAIAHLLQPGATARSIQAALVPLSARFPDPGTTQSNPVHSSPSNAPYLHLQGIIFRILSHSS